MPVSYDIAPELETVYRDAVVRLPVLFANKRAGSKSHG
jgi:hypothetical protein